MALPKLTHPTYTVTLPFSKTVVKFRPWTVAEEKILLMAKEDGGYPQLVNAVGQLFDACVTNTKLDVEKLASVDSEFLFIHLSARSVNNIIPITFTDEAGVTQKANADMTTIVAHLPQKKEVTITLEKDIGLIMRYPTLGDFVDENDPIKMIARCIKTIIDKDTTIDAQTEPMENMIAFVSQFNRHNLEEIEKFFDDIPYVKCDIKYQDQNGQEQVFVLRGMASFFV